MCKLFRNLKRVNLTGADRFSLKKNLKWSSPFDVLERSKNGKVILYPPQAYELHRFSYVKDIEKLNDFARERSSQGDELQYPVILQAKDGFIMLLPGDHLYPSDVDLTSTKIYKEDKTISALRETDLPIHRVETDSKKKSVIVINNYTPKNHINMGNQVTPTYLKLHALN